MAFYILFMFLYTMGFHNIDIAMNMKPNEIDVGFFREPYNQEATYLNGVFFLIFGMMFNMLAFIILLSEYITRNNS